MVKNKNINPSYLLLSPHQRATPGTDPTVVNYRTTDCLLLKSKLHLHFQIMLTSKCILNTHQQGKQEANKVHLNIFLKHAPEF